MFAKKGKNTPNIKESQKQRIADNAEMCGIIQKKKHKFLKWKETRRKRKMEK